MIWPPDCDQWEYLKTLYVYSGADWAMGIRNRRSISSMVLFIDGSVVAWKTRAQPTVALSTAESEFFAASDTGRLSIFMRCTHRTLAASTCINNSL
jgi:hypothetical protein